MEDSCYLARQDMHHARRKEKHQIEKIKILNDPKNFLKDLLRKLLYISIISILLIKPKIRRFHKTLENVLCLHMRNVKNACGDNTFFNPSESKNSNLPKIL